MDDRAALHTAARRYCIAGDAETDVVDVRLLGPGCHGPTFVTDNAEIIALGAILLEVEATVPGDFTSVKDWYPLIEGAPPAHTQAFHERPFNTAIPPTRLQAILAESRVRIE